MQSATDGLCDEVIFVLQAEFECAESIHATSVEVQSLIDKEKFHQAQERLNARGEIVDLMVSLDRRLETLLKRRQSDLDDPQWTDIEILAEKLREMIKSILSMDVVSQARLHRSCAHIGKQLKAMQDGRKLMKSYGYRFEESHHPLYSA